MLYHKKMTWQILRKIPNFAITISPAPSHQPPPVVCCASPATPPASHGARQATEASCAPCAWTRWQRCLAERGEAIFLGLKHGEPRLFTGKFYEDHDQSKKHIWNTFEKCWSGFGCEELKKSWLSWTQKPDMFNGVTKMVEIKWWVFWPKLDGLTNTKRMLMIVLPSGNLT